MPAFVVRWTNRSQVDQDWQIYNPADNFTLHPNYTRLVNVFLNATYTFQVSVTTEAQLAACTVTWTAPNGPWTLNSHTPNEWQLDQTPDTVRVTCFLANAAGDAAEGTSDASYEPSDPQPDEES